MAKTIYELTAETLPDGVLRVCQKRPTADDSVAAFSLQQIDVLIAMLRKCRADTVKISGESVTSENRSGDPAESAKAQHRRDQQSASKSAWRNREP